jgi:hypothetical protein
LLTHFIFYFNIVEDNLEVAARQYGGVRRIGTTLGYLDLGRKGGRVQVLSSKCKAKEHISIPAVVASLFGILIICIRGKGVREGIPMWESRAGRLDHDTDGAS